MNAKRELTAFRESFDELMALVQLRVVGYEELIRDVLIAMFCRGHVLLEGVPGLGKTHLVKIMSEACNLSFGRVQCTPELVHGVVTLLGPSCVRLLGPKRKEIPLPTGGFTPLFPKTHVAGA